VKAAQEKAARLQAEGYLVIILGDPQHPEVKGIQSYAGPQALVVHGPEDLPADFPRTKVGVVVQTTQTAERLASLVAALAPRVRELRLHNTICGATERRQRSAVELARQADLMLVVGGRNSANTTHLAELCRQVQPRTFHIEEAREIEPSWLEGVVLAGVTAGASTPAVQVEAVVQRLKELSP
jgi:4-hydroxy-3-methylbut-2-enyl diphosphate reductase